MKSPRVLNRRPLNIAVLAGHTPYEMLLSETGHNFYSIGGDNVLKWNDLHGVKPYNYTEYNESVFKWIDFDLMITHNPLGHAHIWTKYLHKMPVVCIFHTMSVPNFNKSMWNEFPLNQTTNIFITSFSQIHWGGTGKVIEHTVDDRFVPLVKNDSITAVVNDFINRDREYGFGLWNYIRQNCPGTFEVYGDTPGLSKGLQRDELAQVLGRSGIYLSTALSSPISMSVLEAALAGCAIVSTSCNAIPDYFKHFESALLFNPNHPEDAIECIKMLLDDPELRQKMGNAAREVALKMTKEKFLNSWNEVLYAK
jgi:hypothetical protein